MQPSRLCLFQLCFALMTGSGLQLVSAAAVFYEPFNYSSGGLVDNSSWTSVSSGNRFEVQSSGLSYGTLPVSGAHVRPLGSSGVTLNSGAADIASAGLLNDGATLWMGLLIQPQVSANANTTIRLGTDYVDANSNITGGSGDSVGIHVQNGSDIQARYHHDGAMVNPGNVVTNASLLGPTFVVVEMIWNADNGLADTLNYYVPDSNLNLGSAVRTINTVTFNQANFDTLSMAYGNGNATFLDELTFGATYNDIIAPIPEPSAVSLLGIAGLGMLIRRRR